MSAGWLHGLAAGLAGLTGVAGVAGLAGLAGHGWPGWPGNGLGRRGPILLSGNYPGTIWELSGI